MFVKNSVFIMLLGISCLLNANTLTYPSPSILVNQINTGLCNAPAPTNFHVVNIGTTWVDLSWNASSPTDFHRIRTYETNSGILVSNLLVPPGALVQKVVGLQPNLEYYSRINAVCSNGFDSEEYVEIAYITVIADLIVIGRESNATIPICTIQPPQGSCDFPISGGTETAFMIRPINNPFIFRRFSVSRNPATNFFSTKLKNENTGENYTFQCDYMDPYSKGRSFQIKFSGIEIASFELSYDLSQDMGRLNCFSLNSGYEIIRLGDPQGQGAPPFDPIGLQFKAQEGNQESLRMEALPNPFSESLTVYLAASANGPVNFKLFNLSGQKVLEQQYPAGAEQYELRTSHLPPGFYLLRLEAGNEVQTLKVVKSE